MTQDPLFIIVDLFCGAGGTSTGFEMAETGIMAVPVYEGDSEAMVKIKVFMAAFGLCDIKMRMLRVKELLRIQGFPAEYRLEGTQGEQKKFIGNSVVPLVVKAWIEALANKFYHSQKTKVA